MADSSEKQSEIKVQLDGRDTLTFSVKQDRAQLSAVGCEPLLQTLRAKIKAEGNDPRKWSLPMGDSHIDLLLKELILKSQGSWVFPYPHTEICHCRAIATHKVDQAVIAGAHDCSSVSRQTGASTACGTCRPDVQKIIDYRLSFP